MGAVPCPENCMFSKIRETHKGLGAEAVERALWMCAQDLRESCTKCRDTGCVRPSIAERIAQEQVLDQKRRAPVDHANRVALTRSQAEAATSDKLKRTTSQAPKVTPV